MDRPRTVNKAFRAVTSVSFWHYLHHPNW